MLSQAQKLIVRRSKERRSTTTYLRSVDAIIEGRTASQQVKRTAFHKAHDTSGTGMLEEQGGHGTNDRCQGLGGGPKRVLSDNSGQQVGITGGRSPVGGLDGQGKDGKQLRLEGRIRKQIPVSLDTKAPVAPKPPDVAKCGTPSGRRPGGRRGVPKTLRTARKSGWLGRFRWRGCW